MSGMRIIYEDNHLIAAFKPAGMLVHGDETRDRTLMDEVKAYIKWKFKKPGDVFLGSFHRLDRPVSGVVVFARTSKALERMNKQMKERKITKKYYAVTTLRPKEPKAILKHYLIKNPTKNVSKAYELPNKGRKEGVLEYELVGFTEGLSFLKINLITGRSHQIRAQFKKMGCPILGDIKYGSDRKLNYGVALHCCEMSFLHPVKKEQLAITIQPDDREPWTLFDMGN